MIPVKLTIQGLYSYQQRQTIDFSTLTGAGLFGIFGTVGSGKSSILEAITFALYGETDRLNSRDGRGYNMMNLKSDELLIDFEFETGKKQERYRAMVKGRRNSKRFDDVKTLERTAYKRTGSDWSPMESAELEKAIGLSYENFKRTIIIPQGQFQEFLQLGNSDRTKMMKELFGLEKFELFYKVTALETKNNGHIQLVQGQLMQLGEIDPEQINTFNAQLIQLKKDLDEWNEKLKTAQNTETQWQQIKELAEKFETAKAALENLQKQQPGFIQLENNIQQYEKCFTRFKNILDALETSNKKILQKTNQIAADTLQLEKFDAEIKQNETAINGIKQKYESRELLKKKAGELENVIKIKELASSIEKEQLRLEKGSLILTETNEKVAKLKTDLDNLSKEIKAQKLKLPDLSVLSNIKTWFVEKTNLENQTTETETEIRKYQSEENNIKADIQLIFNLPVFAGFHDEKITAKAIAFLNSAIESAKNHIKLLEKEESHLRVKAQLEKYATGLNEGEPCPLCGSKHHPEIYSAENIHGELQQIDLKKQAFETEIEKLTETISQFKDLDTKFQFNAKTLAGWKTRLTEINLKTGSHVYNQSWPEYQNRQEIENAFNSAKLLQDEIKKQETELEKNTELLGRETKNKERFQGEIEKIRTALTAQKATSETLITQLKMVSVDEFSTKNTSEIEAEKLLLLQKYSQLEKQFADLTSVLTKLHETRNTLNGTLTANKLELVSEQKTNSELLLQIEYQLKQTGYSNIGEIKEILSQPIELEKQKKLLEDFKQNLALANDRCEALQKQLDNRVYDGETHQKLIAEINNIKETITKINQESGRVTELLKVLNEKLISQADLKKSFAELELRADNIKTMKSLFKASGYVNYISSVYLQNLCNSANDRFFKITRQKLSLEITADNNFQVRDFMNGGKVRNVKTLSGGQTFQAALSLALALADNIQKITESNQNFFFLDEGFGSLDKESLSIVFDTLKSLRHENRIVGVISHVEEMQQEIEVHLRVINSDETGSKILESWAG